jgi:DNA-binding PadR family transcriptional regulator
MKFETLLTQFEELEEMVDNSQPELHLDRDMQKQLYEFEEEVEYAKANVKRFELTEEQKRTLKTMVRFIAQTKDDISSALEEFNEGLRDDMNPNRFEDPQDSFDY